MFQADGPWADRAGGRKVLLDHLQFLLLRRGAALTPMFGIVDSSLSLVIQTILN